MNKLHPKTGILFGFFLMMLCFQVVAQPALYPTDNPYKTRYPQQAGQRHWTDSINWNNVLEIGLVPNLVNPNTEVDSALFVQTVQALSNQGGGVLYFPGGIYKFNFHVELPSLVALRGETPLVTTALDTNFAPPAILQFPLYQPTFTGSGTPNSGYFKSIGGVANARNMALIDLDINGASIAFHPHEWQAGTGRISTKQPQDVNSNVLILGIRSNNTATPDPAVPSLCQQSNNGGWQRWVWSFSANIDVLVARNAIVANCRLNDAPTMTYFQPGYFYGDGTNCSPSSQCTAMATDGSDARFDVTAHYGIVVNRAKINKDGQIQNNFGTGVSGPYGIYAWQTYGEPETEPYLFVNGVEVMDNWIYKTNRIGIQAAGNGLKVLRNKILDKVGKSIWISPNGTRCNVNNAATFENRGIDVSGWNVQVSWNNVMVEQATIRSGPFLTVDGEGILVQECCGGTSVKNYTFTHNLMQRGHTGYIGLWAMRDLYDVRVDSNFMNCEPIFFMADYAGAPVYFKINNGSIKGNTDVSGINVTGTAGGSNMVVADNTACGNATISGPCYVTTSNNTGMTVNNCTTAPTLTFPSLVITNPLTGSNSNLPNTVTIDWTVQDADSVSLWANAVRIMPYQDVVAGSTFNWVPTAPGIYYLTAQGKNSANVSYSAPVIVEVRDTIAVTGLDKLQFEKRLVVAPNPATESFTLFGLDAQAPAEVELLTASGQSVKTIPLLSGQQTITRGNLSKGFYLVRVRQQGHTATTRLVLE